MSSYVKTIDNLYEIYEYGVRNPTERTKIELIANKTTISWCDFFFSTKHLPKLLSRIHNENDVQAAIIVNSYLISAPSHRHNNFRFIEFYPYNFSNGNKIVPVVRLSKSISAQKFKTNTKYLIYGRFKETPLKKKFTLIYPSIEIATMIDADANFHEI